MPNAPKRWSLPCSSDLNSIDEYLKNKYHSKVKTSKLFCKDSQKSSGSYGDRLNALAQDIRGRHTDFELEALKIRYEYEVEEHLRVRLVFPFLIACLIAFIWPADLWPADKYSTDILALFKKLSALLPFFAITCWLRKDDDLKEYLRVAKLALLVHRPRE